MFSAMPFDKTNSLMPGISEVPQDFDQNNDDEQALARKCDELVNKPYEKMNNNEKRMLIEHLKTKVKEKEKLNKDF